jgi:membrane protein DedA with SNARE-associated domain
MTAILHGLLGVSQWWFLAAIFIVVMLESCAFLGVVFPGEAAALAAGALASANVVSVWWAFGAVAGGAALGDICGYALGRWKGEALLARWRFARRQHERHRRTLESYFARWGAATLLVGRFVAVGRAFIPFTAGLYEMRVRRFLPIALFAGVLWGAVVVALGYLVGAHLSLVEQWLGSLGLGIFILFLVTIGAVMLWRWLLARQDRVRAAWRQYVAEPYGVEIEPLIDFVRARLSPAGYLGLHLTLGLIALVLMAWLFGGVAQDIFAQDPLVRVDRFVAIFIAHHRTPALDSVMAAAEFIGGAWATLAVAAITAAALAYAGEKLLALAALPMWAGAYGVGFALQVLFSLFTPEAPPSRLIHGFHHFPSVAMVAATAAYGIAGSAIAMYAADWRWRTVGAVGTLYLVVVIALGAIYRGDLLSAVIAGFAAGGCWLAICLTGFLTYQKLSA